jgi:hypothetical protein
MAAAAAAAAAAALTRGARGQLACNLTGRALVGTLVIEVGSEATGGAQRASKALGELEAPAALSMTLLLDFGPVCKKPLSASPAPDPSGAALGNCKRRCLRRRAFAGGAAARDGAGARRAVQVSAPEAPARRVLEVDFRQQIASALKIPLWRVEVRPITPRAPPLDLSARGRISQASYLSQASCLSSAVSLKSHL